MWVFERGEFVKAAAVEQYQSRMREIQDSFGKRQIVITKPISEFPELFVRVPDEWPCVKLAPLYDVHFGNELHASTTFLRHVEWLKNEPNVLTWNGGDLIENAIIGSPGIYNQRKIPQEQHDAAVEIVAPFQHKMLFAIPGNHEARTSSHAGFDIARNFADDLNIPYFSDYAFVTIKWRNNNFRICAHHGSGGSATPGAQRNAARKDMPWVSADMYWTGHLHQPIVDLAYRSDFDQASGQMVTRQSFVIISPSYLKYFHGYAAAKRLMPGVIGLTAVELQEDGTMKAELHAKGMRL